MSIHNDIHTVDRSIASIVCQTYQDWEFLICNDASTDGSMQILLDWAEKDKRISVVENERNIGLAASLNRLLDQARGEYIARMDGDDVSLPGRFEKQVEFLDQNPAYAFVGSSCYLFDETGEWGKRNTIEKPAKENFLWGTRFAHPTVMLRRDALASVGGYRVSRETMRGEDFDLWMRMYARGFIGYNIQEPLFRYYESRNPVRKRKYRYRIDEAIIRAKGYRQLGLLPRGVPYVIKPLLVGLIPYDLKRKIQKVYYGRKEKKEGSPK
jgi:glycosyltransferase involved in cell wall biosynthesis